MVLTPEFVLFVPELLAASVALAVADLVEPDMVATCPVCLSLIVKLILQ